MKHAKIQSKQSNRKVKFGHKWSADELATLDLARKLKVGEKCSSPLNAVKSFLEARRGLFPEECSIT